MADRRMLAFFGLKYDPFLPDLPVDDIWISPKAESFLFRVETLVLDGGFAVLSGPSGLGKSKLLQLLAHRLAQIDGVVVRDTERPTSSLGDFYRELGDLFGVTLSVANRYGSFKALRDKWRTHVKNTLMHPVLLLDEAQETAANTLNELRILGSERFDSKNLLTVVLCGDDRLPARFRRPELIPLGTRVRTRLVLQPYAPDELRALLDHLLDRAGAPALLTDGLRDVLVRQCLGNPRVLCNTAHTLLVAAYRKEQAVLDEGLYLEVADRVPAKASR